jgi:uncharacterized protein (TIGR02145 family)
MKKILFSAVILSFVFTACNEPDNSAVTGVFLEYGYYPIFLDDTLNLGVVVAPASAINQTVFWTSSHTNIAMVTGIETDTTKFGKVVPQAPGKTEITVTTQEGNFSAVCTVEVVEVFRNRCNREVFELGEVSFASSSEWVITGPDVTQTWSDAVTATNCKKTDFNGGVLNNFNADCRSNPDYSGDLFSWCAIVRFQDQLCPGDWRVPTRQDFIDLDMTMVGFLLEGTAGSNRLNASQSINNYYLNPNEWGGSYSGYCSENGTLINQTSEAYYWAVSETSPSHGSHLFFNSIDYLFPQQFSFKNFGFTLRCVK